jgi:DNA-binding GntR family transcriptional regulator
VKGGGLDTNFEPVRVNLGQQVYDYLRDQIYNMEIEPGTRLGVGDIADKLGVSRSPVRDAFVRLMAEGIVEPSASGRYRVLKLTRKYIEDIFVIRRALELAAVRLCVENLDEKRVRQLRDTWQQFRQGYEVDSQFVEMHASADHSLHRNIAEMSQNPLLTEALDRIMSLAALIRRWTYVGQVPNEMLTTTADEHLKVLDAILRRDADGAVAALDEHLNRAQARTLNWLDLRDGHKS